VGQGARLELLQSCTIVQANRFLLGEDHEALQAEQPVRRSARKCEQYARRANQRRDRLPALFAVSETTNQLDEA